MKKLLLISLVAFTLAAPAIHGAVYVGSTFTDSITGGNGRKQVVTTNNSNLTPWYLLNSTGNSNFTVVNDTATGGLGKSATLVGNIITGTSFDAIQLKIGETLTISFDYRFLTAPTSGGTNYLRIMLYNSGASSFPVADVSSGVGPSNYSGYYFGLGVDKPSTSGLAVIQKRNVNNMNAIASNGGLTSLGSSGQGMLSDTAAHSVVLKLTRNETSSFLTMAIDGETVASATDTSGTYSLFNALIINNQSGSGVNVNLDNIVLSVIPEPGAVSLSVLGVGALCYGVMRAKVAQTK